MQNNKFYLLPIFLNDGIFAKNQCFMATNIEKPNRNKKADIFSVLVPYEFAFGCYDLTNYQYRMLLQLFIKAKEFEEGFFKPKITALSEVTKVVEMECNIRDLLMDDDKHYTKFYSDVKELGKRAIEIETIKDGNTYHLINNFITAFEHCKTKGQFKVWWPYDLWDVAVKKVHGWRIVDLRTLFKLKSFYSIRFYQFFSRQTAPRRFEINELRHMFQLQDKYEGVNMFLRKVVDTAKKELDSKSPLSFTYTIETSSDNTPGKPKITAINCMPRYQSNLDENNELFNTMFLDNRTKQSIRTFEDFKKVAGIVGDQLEDLFKKCDFNYNIDVDWKGEKISMLCKLYTLWIWLGKQSLDKANFSVLAIRPLFEGWMRYARKSCTTQNERKAYIVGTLKKEIVKLEELKNKITNEKNGEIFR